MSARRLFPALAAALLAGCAPAAPGRIDPCAPPAVATAGWETHDAGAFTLRLPPGFRRMAVTPVDSRVEVWSAGPGRRVSYDLGAWSSRLEELRALEGHAECAAEVGGGRAKLVSGWDAEGQMFAPGPPKHVVAAAWRDIVPGVHLTIGATTPDRAEAERLLALLRSVELHPERLEAPR